jgi:molybdopterin molybdotransferase
LTFQEARACILERVHGTPATETVALDDADGRVLAADIAADRDYPPVARSVRDGFAVRSADRPSKLRVIGEVRAGQIFNGSVGPGEAVEIMTGAPMPDGADAVIMVEHVERDGAFISSDRAVSAGDFVNPAGSEARRNHVVLRRATTIGFRQIAMAASVGCQTLPVYQRPRVAIISTGDEVLPISEVPLEYQVRNSNSHSIAAQVKRAGGVPLVMGIAEDLYEPTRAMVERALDEGDLLLLAGGVSAGKYDIVENVLAGLGAEFYFDRVKIQPGQPLVFGRVRGRFFFGLPGNPGSTMVTFEVLARAAVERLAGIEEPLLPLLCAPLAMPFRHKTGLTRFLPAIVDGCGRLTPVRWGGSSDVPALARANAFLVAEPERESWEAGELMRVLLQ